jgi:hypothetical protein
MRSSLDLYRMLRESVEALPQEQRRMLHAVLLERTMDDPLAERYVGTMSDTELARVLVDVGERFDRDPTELAARLVNRRLRSDDLIDLTDALWKGRIEGGTVLAGVGELAVPRRPKAGDTELGLSEEMHETVGDILGQSLLARGQKDLGLLREGFPSTADAQHKTAFVAVQDYLIVEEDLERLDRVMEAWTQTARTSLRAADATGLREAIAVLERPRAAAADNAQTERVMLFDGYLQDAAGPAILRELVERAKGPEGVEPVVALLAVLDDAALEALLDLMADEDEGADRSLMVAIATELARGHFDVLVRRLEHQRSQVARDAVLVAYRSAGAGAMPLLERAARHPSPEVRAEGVRGIVAVAGGSGVGLLRNLTRDNDEQVRQTALSGLGGLVVAESIPALEEVVAAPGETSMRQGALEHLARHPVPLARERLKALGARRGPVKLPRQLRRHARQLGKKG